MSCPQILFSFISQNQFLLLAPAELWSSIQYEGSATQLQTLILPATPEKAWHPCKTESLTG